MAVLAIIALEPWWREVGRSFIGVSL